MRFGRVAVADAVGAICAHTLRIGPGIVFKKGRCLSASDVATLQQALPEESFVIGELATGQGVLAVD